MVKCAIFLHWISLRTSVLQTYYNIPNQSTTKDENEDGSKVKYNLIFQKIAQIEVDVDNSQDNSNEFLRNRTN